MVTESKSIKLLSVTTFNQNTFYVDQLIFYLFSNCALSQQCAALKLSMYFAEMLYFNEGKEFVKKIASQKSSFTELREKQL